MAVGGTSPHPPIRNVAIASLDRTKCMRTEASGHALGQQAMEGSVHAQKELYRVRQRPSALIRAPSPHHPDSCRPAEEMRSAAREGKLRAQPGRFTSNAIVSRSPF